MTATAKTEHRAERRRTEPAFHAEPAGLITDIAVHLTGSAEDDVRLGYAEPIARAFDAHLTGLLFNEIPDLLTVPDAGAARILAEMTAEAETRAEATTKTLAAKFDKLQMPYDLRRIDDFRANSGHRLATHVRNTDLFVGTRPYGDPTGTEFLEEQVLFESGRGCLFVPPGGTPPRSYATVLVAWKETREAARAVAEAIPFLRRAPQVIVMLVEEDGAGEQFRIEAGADIGRYLSRHGVSAEIRKVNGWVYSGEAILNEARLTGADMIVMGGYGHSRFREWVLGGATRHVLTHASVPVFMAH